MNIEIVRSVGLRYIRLFPELLNRYHNDNDMTIVRLISDNVISSKEITGVIDKKELEKEIQKTLEIKK
jgi:hypothetical protein